VEIVYYSGSLRIFCLIDNSNYKIITW